MQHNWEFTQPHGYGFRVYCCKNCGGYTAIRGYNEPEANHPARFGLDSTLYTTCDEILVLQVHQD